MPVYLRPKSIDWLTYSRARETLGLINIDQNNILKIFSVATVVLLPPSVIGAVFGMNFSYLPTAEHPLGFFIAVAAMIVSAAGPYLFFKWRGWL